VALYYSAHTGCPQTGWAARTSGDSIGTAFIEDSALAAAKYIEDKRPADQAGSGFVGMASGAGSETGATPAGDHAAEPERAAAHLPAAGHMPAAAERLAGHSDSPLRVGYPVLDYCSMTLLILTFLIY
jgi:hypothetical protein